MKRKRLFLVWTLGITMLLSSPAWARKSVGFTFTGGVASGGLGDANLYLNDYRVKLQEFASKYSLPVTGDFRQVKSGMDWSIEGTLRLSKRFSLGLGSGFIRYRRGQEQIVTPNFEPLDDSPGSLAGREPSEQSKATNSLAYTIDTIPLTLSGYYHIPLASKLALSLGGGIGYYFCRWTQISGSILDWPGYLDKTEVHFDTHAGNVGGQASLNLEWDLSKKVALVCGAVGRLLSVKGFKGEGWIAADPPYIGCGPVKGTLYYYQNQGFLNGLTVFKEAPDRSNYREAEISLSGFSIRAGVRVSL